MIALRAMSPPDFATIASIIANSDSFRPTPVAIVRPVAGMSSAEAGAGVAVDALA